MSHDLHPQTSIFAANAAGSAWWVCDMFYRHGPSWHMVPPILIGASSLIGAVRGYANDKQNRLHKDELHRVDLERRRSQHNAPST